MSIGTTTPHRRSTEECRRSTVDLTDVPHVFCASMARSGNSVQLQALDALKRIESAVGSQGSAGTVVSQTVFYSDEQRLDELCALMRDFYGPDLPVTTYVPQQPCGGKPVAIEAIGIVDDHGNVQIERSSEQCVMVRHNGSRWLYFGQIVPRTNDESVHARSLNCFEQIQAILKGAEFQFDEIIRTWIYQGSITDSEGKRQRYQELNRARADFFTHREFGQRLLPPSYKGTVFPASTGIGTASRDMVMSGIAFATDCKDIVAIPLENPRQTAAFDYASRYSPSSPRFSRAMAVCCDGLANIFISGTASITKSETRHKGDIEAQTHETIDNIEALISEQNLSQHGLPGHGTDLRGLKHVRVYLKNPNDFPVAHAVCNKRLGKLPTIYAVADICRSDLLVEIEGLACTNNVAG